MHLTLGDNYHNCLKVALPSSCTSCSSWCMHYHSSNSVSQLLLLVSINCAAVNVYSSSVVWVKACNYIIAKIMQFHFSLAASVKLSHEGITSQCWHSRSYTWSLLMNAVVTSTLCIEWHSFHLPRSIQPKWMTQLPDFPTVLLQLGENATSGGGLFKTSLEMAERS